MAIRQANNPITFKISLKLVHPQLNEILPKLTSLEFVKSTTKQERIEKKIERSMVSVYAMF